MDRQACVFVGIDWADRDYECCAVGPDGEVIEEEKSFSHTGEGLIELVQWLERLAKGSLEEVWVAIEVPRGAVVETLLERGCQVFSINPKQVDRFRDRHFPSGAKDDSRDAFVMAASLRTDRRCFRHLRMDDRVTIELREWSRIHEELIEERGRCTSRFRQQLHRYFPQYLEVVKDLAENWVLDVWLAVPTPQRARKISAKEVAAILKRRRIRRLSGSQVVETLRKKPLSVAPGTVEAATAHIRLLVARLKVVNEQLRECERHIDKLIEQAQEPNAEEETKGQRDAAILLSAPGLGKIVLATLLSEAADVLRDRDYHTLHALSGVAPVTKRTGKKTILVVMRRACSQQLRRACYHWARVAIQHDARARDLYARQRKRGKRHGQALRAVAGNLLTMVSSMLRHRTLYDPSRRGLQESKAATA